MAGVFSFKSARAVARIEKIKALLAVDALAVVQLCPLLHAEKSSINHYIKYLREQRVIHVAKWVDIGGQRPAAAYALGNLPDAPFPTKSKADYWKEVKSNPARMAIVNESRAKTREKKRGGRPLLRECRKYDSPLTELCRAHIEAWPGSTTRQVCEKIGATWGGTKQAVSDLKRQGVIKAEKRTRAGSNWVLASRKPVRHAPLVTKPQGIFAALGV